VKRGHFWRPVLISLLIASAFWLLNALNQTHSAVIQRPLELVYNHTQLAVSGEVPKLVDLQVKGQGWSILRSEFSMTRKPKVQIPIDKPGSYRLTSKFLAAHAQKNMPTLDVKEAIIIPITVEARKK
jgi:hypothetical protein